MQNLEFFNFQKKMKNRLFVEEKQKCRSYTLNKREVFAGNRLRFSPLCEG